MGQAGVKRRMTLEVEIGERPFKEGETLWTYAERIAGEEGLQVVIHDVSAHVQTADVTANGDKQRHYWPIYQTVTIDVQLCD